MQGVNATQPTADMVANNPSIDDGHKNLIRRYVCLVCVSGCCCELTIGLTTFWGSILFLGIWCLHEICLKQTEPMYLRVCKHKVKIFWERHKIWKIFHLFWNYLVTSKQIEYLNFCGLLRISELKGVKTYVCARMLLQMEVQPHCEPFRYLFLFVFQIPSVITKAFGTKEFLLQFEKILPKLCTARHKLLNQLQFA